MALLFVYGTLRRADPSGKSALLAPCQFLGEGKVAGRLFDLGEYPGATPDDSGDHWVAGEVVELEDFTRQIEILDLYEGIEASAAGDPAEYRRALTPVALADGGQQAAWIYWLNGSVQGLNEIISGDWLD